MAKEITDEEAWKNWRKSSNPELRRAADKYMPVLSIREELDAARKEENIQKLIYIGKVITKYTNPEKRIFTKFSMIFLF